MRHVKVISVLVVLAVLASVQWSAHAAPLPQDVGPRAVGQQGGDAALLAQLAQATDNNVRMSRHAETGKVRFLATDPQHPIQRPAGTAGTVSGEQAARDFLVQYGGLFGIRDQAQELRTQRSRSVQRNTFTRFQQTYRSVPVFGAEISVHTTQDANVVSANGEIVPDLALDTTPRLTAAQATTIATGAIAKGYNVAANTFTATEPQLWLYNPLTLGAPGLRQTALVWRMDLVGEVAGEPVRELVLVDAHVGTVALHFNQVEHGKDRRVCDFKNVPNPDNTCTPDQYVRVEGQPPTGQEEADRAYDIHGAVYDYYFHNFGRDSIDNKGLPLIATVRYCPNEQACPFQNAYWDGKQMTYGEGFIVDDVVAHELTHGVTENESHLFYYYQSGAINESLSDVFGELFDQQYAAGSNDAPDVRWLLGEDLPESIGVIRSMKNPPQFDDPDRILSPLYWDRESDRGGVHSNSGINNKAAYLMTDGDTFNGQTIKGIGAYKTAYIYYTANTQYLLSASDYQDLADILPQACDFLAQPGFAITTAADCREVRKVVLATEMNQTPRTTAPEATVCAANQTPNDVFFDNLENINSGNWVSAATQPDLSPINAWFYPQNPNPLDFDATYATSGQHNFWGYNYGGIPGITPPEQQVPGDYNIAMTRDVHVPPNAYMHFRHSYDFEAAAFARFDGGVVEYSVDGGKTYQDAGALFINNGYNGSISRLRDNPLKLRDAFVNRSKGYISSRADLGSLAGKNVRFRFRIGTDSLYDDYGWFIDDIRIYTCGTATPLVKKVYMPVIGR